MACWLVLALVVRRARRSPPYASCTLSWLQAPLSWSASSAAATAATVEGLRTNRAAGPEAALREFRRRGREQEAAHLQPVLAAISGWAMATAMGSEAAAAVEEEERQAERWRIDMAT